MVLGGGGGVCCFGVLVYPADPLKGAMYRTKSFIVIGLSRQFWILQGRDVVSWKGLGVWATFARVDKPRELRARSGDSCPLCPPSCLWDDQGNFPLHCRCLGMGVGGKTVAESGDSYVPAP